MNKVRQLFAERNQHVHGPGNQHQRRQRRRSLTGRDRSRPLRPLSDPDNDPLSKTVYFTTPSLVNGADLVGINDRDGGTVRNELLALFGRLPNLGGQLLSESFRGGKMKTAQSAPELKWLLDGSTGPGGGGRGGGGDGTGPGPAVAVPGKVGGGPGPPAGKAGGGVNPKGPPAKVGPRAAGKGAAAGGDVDDDNDDDDDEQQVF